MRGCLTAALLIVASIAGADDCMATVGWSASAGGMLAEAGDLPGHDILTERTETRHRRFIADLLAQAETLQAFRETMPDTPAAASWDRSLGEAQNAIRVLAVWADFYRSDPDNAATDQYVEMMRRISDSSEMVRRTLAGGEIWQGLLALSGCSWAEWPQTEG